MSDIDERWSRRELIAMLNDRTAESRKLRLKDGCAEVYCKEWGHELFAKVKASDQLLTSQT